jgi:isopentenyl-diphosphate delta-isomerase
MRTQQRKKEHIKIALENKVETGDPGFDDVLLVHNDFTDINFKDIDTSTKFFGKKLKLPLIMASMTGGTDEAKKINKDLAEIAEKKGFGFSLGSQRAMIENPELKDTYYVRDVAPNTLIFGNLGIYQLKSFSKQQIEDAMKSVGADILCVHINPSQELFQREGDLDFKGSFSNLKKLCEELKYPVIGKEVGFGFSREVSTKLKEAGVKAIDVGGHGGTNWIVVDGLRSDKDFSSFVDWGIPTTISILESRVGLPLISTGGVRNGVDIAKSIALGADVCGMALPFLRILNEKGKKGVEDFVDKVQQELKIVMALTGSRNIEDLKKAKYVLTGRVKDWADQRDLI